MTGRRVAGRAAIAVVVVALGAGCGTTAPSTNGPTTTSATATTTIEPTATPAAFAEHFDDPAALNDWQITHGEAMSGPASEVSVVDGALHIVSAHSKWLDNAQGTGIARSIDGDVTVTATVAVAGENTPDPTVDWSLAGIMLREPGDVAYENWVHWSAGHVASPVLERKSTRRGESQLMLIAADPGPVVLQMIRAGDEIFLLHRQGSDPWTVDFRYARPDIPSAAEVLLTAQSGGETDHGDMVATFDDVSIVSGAPSAAVLDALRAGDASGLTT